MARLKLFSLGVIEALLGPAVEAGPGDDGFWITLNERDGEVVTSGEMLEGEDDDDVGLATGSGANFAGGAGADDVATAGSATACG